MEVAGVVIGALALVGVFEDCVTLFSQFGAAKTFETDYVLLATRLDLQKALLLQWAERMRIYDEELCDPRLDDPNIGSVIYKTLDCIRKLLQDGSALQDLYGVRLARMEERTESSGAASSGLMSRLRHNPLALRLRRAVVGVPIDQSRSLHESSGGHCSAKRPRPDIGPSPPHQEAMEQQRTENSAGNKRLRRGSLTSESHGFDQLPIDNRKGRPFNLNKIKWIIRDKQNFQSLVRKVSEMISDIERLVPPQEDAYSKHTILEHDLQALESIAELKRIMHASAADNSEFTSVAERVLYTRLILKRLWFRLIDDRKHNIADAHSKTYEWSINPPTSRVVWDDLGQWLRSGRDIYWIHGKPGSGKSTLMKFLYQHPKVMSLLREWAGNRKLTVASFFLWNIGTTEQSSQEGLARGLLYHVLSENQKLTPVILPNMWQEAQKGIEDLSLPSKSEIKLAFQQLGLRATTGAFTFFIDGLDEFTGNHRDGRLFIQSLVAGTNIKLLVSSRPIDTFVAAFSSAPKLRLQDLTKPDIELYVTDLLQSHPYVTVDKCLSVETVQRLAEDIQSKASGVFLWVVLACRSLIEGFEAYDNAEELQWRVEDLPPELEDLFRHILSSLPSQSLQQAAKLLRICYTRHLLQYQDEIMAFPLAWAHEQDMKVHAFGRFLPLSRSAQSAKCAMLEGRLRSRCRGLLEMNLHHPSKSRMVVDFMHRTVFEFLGTPGVWEMDCLQIDDYEFDATIILAYMTCYNLFLYPNLESDGAGFAISVGAYVEKIRKSSPSNLRGLLNRFAFAILKPGDDEDASSTTDVDSSMDHDTFLLAIELNLTEHIQGYDLGELRGHGSTLGRSLLCYAFEKPLISATSMQSHARSEQDMVDYLIRSGCDPNEMTRSWTGSRTTPWETWLNDWLRVGRGENDVINLAGVTMTMIRAGAKISGHGQDLRYLSDAWLQRSRSLVDVQEQEWLREISSEVRQALGVDHDDTSSVVTDYEDDSSEAETDKKNELDGQATDDEGDSYQAADTNSEDLSDD